MSEPPIEEESPIVYGWADAPISGDRVDVHLGPLVAGDPLGARVEVTATGLHAYDAGGTETATIQGEGGEFVGGSFRTSDALPGQVALADDAYVTHFAGGGTFPGLRVVPIDTSDVSLPAAIGPAEKGLTIFGGRKLSGGSSIVQANPDASLMRTFRDDGTRGGEIQTSPTASYMRTHQADGTAGGEIQASPAESYMRTYRADGTIGGSIQTSPTTSFMQTYSDDGGRGQIRATPTLAEVRVLGSDNLNRARITADANTVTLFSATNGQTYLRLDSEGISAESGGSKVSLIPQVRQFQYSDQWNADLSPSPIMVQHLPGGKLCQAQIRIQNLTGSSLALPYDTWVTLNYNPIPSDLRGGYTDYIEMTLPQLNARGRVEMNYSTGAIRVKSLEKDSSGNGVTINWTNNGSIWFSMRWFSPN